MKILLLIALCFVINIANAQIDTLVENDTERKDTVFKEVDVKPEFPGGESEMKSFLVKNTKYPKKDRRNKFEGTSYVSFVIEKDGSISNVEIKDELASKATQNMHNEAIRVVKSMPHWKPGMLNGEYVRVRFILPLTFRLNDE